VLDLDATLRRIRAAGKPHRHPGCQAGRAHLVKRGAQLLYYHADPFVADGVAAMRRLTSPR
jgi:4-hydroxy-2-oxoheptanedioate aldolase